MLAVGLRAVAVASGATNRLLTVVTMSIQRWAAMGKHLQQASDRPIIETNTCSRPKSMSIET